MKQLSKEEIHNQLNTLNTENISTLFKLMSEEIRFKLIYILSHQEKMCVSELADFINASVATTSHHLQLLKKYELVESTREGKQIFYSIHHPKVLHLMKAGFDF
ncbi:winged helix-turn-helix transcriptional regulator [Vagococcus sp. DIV0080]|uniref:Winged helix-turn-helix transcriptional regulator n=1 Tax=Candidatus Vagococcus giribetii TaxID=2230876 RepID=A0ABS3HRW1_9ENTE|nr:metalloregulator ArsR/SmtB family transcription factor [Vagococcus sp. DIV0080]MBO0476503.1 winged helix-turn-helix transcriptional regulator [Vagococcus sp. DIV0080]